MSIDPISGCLANLSRQKSVAALYIAKVRRLTLLSHPRRQLRPQTDAAQEAAAVPADWAAPRSHWSAAPQ